MITFNDNPVYTDALNVYYEGIPVKTLIDKGKVLEDPITIPDKILDSNYETSREHIYLERPKFCKVYMYGVNLSLNENNYNALDPNAADKNANTPYHPTNIQGIIFVMNEEIVLHAKVGLIEKLGNDNFYKHSFSVILKNNQDKELEVKFGDMFGNKEILFKGWLNERTHSRDLGTYNLWRDMIALVLKLYPPNQASLNNNVPDNIDNSYTESGTDIVWTHNKNDVFTMDAGFCAKGFPCSLYTYKMTATSSANSIFDFSKYTNRGLYTVRTTKDIHSYALNQDNQNHIYLHLDTTNKTKNILGGTTMENINDYWKIKCPKSLSSSDPRYAGINNLFSTLKLFDVESTSTTIGSINIDILHKPAWISWILLTELTCSTDTCGNNYELMSWDQGKHWSIMPQDYDTTLGILTDSTNIYDINNTRISGGTNPSFYSADNRGGALANNPALMNDDERKTWDNIKKRLLYEIKEVWASLRSSGFATVGNLLKYYFEQVEGIPRSVYLKDYEQWSNSGDQAGYVKGMKVSTMDHLVGALDKRIKFLDAVLK